MRKSDWWFLGAALMIGGGIMIAVEIWTVGAAAYEGSGRRGDSFERIIRGLASFFGDKGAAVIVGMTGIGIGVALAWAAIRARRN